MFCETCGKKLIRGYSFCVDCGTPVPPGAFDEDDTPPVEELKPGMGTGEDSMPGIQPKHSASVEGGNLSSGSGVPLFNTDNTGFGGLGIGGDPDQAVVNLFGAPSSPSGISAIGGFNSSSSNIDMPSIEAPAKTSQAKQKEPEKGQERLMNDFSMTAAAADETLEMTDRAVTVLGSASMDENVGADIDLSPYKFLDNKIDMGEEIAEPKAPEPVAVEPEAPEPAPVAVAVEEPKPVEPEAPEPVPVAVAVEPEPVAVAVEEPKPVEPEAPEPVPVAVAVEEPVPTEPKPAEPEAPEPAPVAVAVEEPKPADPEAPEPVPVAVAVEEPKPVEPEPVAVAVAVEEPKPAEPEAPEPVPVAVEPTPVVVAVEEPKAPAVAKDDIDDFIPEEMSVIEESSPFIEEIPLLSAPPKAEPANTDPDKTVLLGTASSNAAPAKTVPDAPVVTEKEKLRDQPRPASPGADDRTVLLTPNTPNSPNIPKTQNTPKTPNSPNIPKAPSAAAPKPVNTVPPVAASSPQRGEQVREKQPKKLFGFLPVSAVVGMASVVVVMTALIIFLATRGDNNSVPVVSGSNVSVTPGSTSVVASSSVTPIESSVVSSEETSQPVESSTTGEVSSSVVSTTEKSVQSSTRSQTPSSKPKPSSSSKPVKPPVSSTPTVTPPPSNSMTYTASIHETDRKKLADTASVILGEAGKLYTYSLLASKLSKDDNTFPPRLKTNLLKSIDDGRNNVQAAMVRVSNVNSSLSAGKKSIDNLKSKYDDFYNYVKKTASVNELTGYNYYQAVENAMRNVCSNQFSSSYNSNDKELAKKSMNTTAVGIINSTYSKLYNLRGKFEKTSLNYADSAYNALANNYVPFMDVVSNVYKVKAYCVLMSDDAIIGNNYDTLYKRVDAYINLDKYAGKYNDFYNAVY